MGRFTDYIGDAFQRIRDDPWQLPDMFLPGNIRQDGRFNPAGIAAGAGQVALGLPAALTEPLIGRIGGMLSGQSPGSIPRPNAIRDNRAAGVPRIDSAIPANEQGQVVRAEVDPRMQVGGDAPVRSSGPSFGGNNMVARGGPGGTISSQRGLGLGQLGRGGDESLAAFAASLFTRGGTQAEQ